MSKSTTVRPRAPLPSLAPGALPAKSDQHLGRTIRETVESIVIAFVLAFLFRTFEAEAFVIPTGSMAPTLQGRHKDLDCENCGYRVRASASDEDRAADLVNNPRDRDQIEADIANSQVVAVTCPLCRFRTNTSNSDEFPSYNGDRILVAKFPYDFVEPDRWDIVVFKFPNDAKTNYIKRLVGLPHETVKLFHGDVFTKPDGGVNYQIQRKSPVKQLAMAQIVYDNNYLVPQMAADGWPLRWQAWPGDKPTGWTASDDGKSFELKEPAAEGDAWIRYQHFPPSQRDWTDLLAGGISKDEAPRPQLITDFYAYNAGIPRRARHGATIDRHGLHWVGDLMLEATVEVQNDKGNLLLDLVEGGVHFGARIDVATGEATLSIDADDKYQPRGATNLKGAGTYEVRFANFDDQLTLWINGTVVEFDAPTTYDSLGNDVPQSSPEDAGDLTPAGVGLSAGLAGTVSDLVLKRDIYYIADKLGTRDSISPLCDYGFGTRLPNLTEEDRAMFFSDPKAWQSPEHKGRTAFELRREVIFPLEADQFFVLGDNSPASADSRLWDHHHHFVGREMMIGKALFIYWPHGLYEIPGTGIPFPGGMFPNFRDMGFVR